MPSDFNRLQVLRVPRLLKPKVLGIAWNAVVSGVFLLFVYDNTVRSLIVPTQPIGLQGYLDSKVRWSLVGTIVLSLASEISTHVCFN